MHVRYTVFFSPFSSLGKSILIENREKRVKIYERTRVSFSVKGTGMHRRFYLVLLYAPPFISI